jgi:hypothetical protein
VWVGYQAHEEKKKRLEVVSIDRPSRTVVVRFRSSPTTYSLSLDEDRKALHSAGSDGSPVQRFERTGYP